MGDFFEHKFSIGLAPIIITFLIVAGVFSYSGYRYYLLNNDFLRAKDQFEETSKNLQSAIENLQANLASSTVENRDLNDLLIILRARNTDFQNEILEKNQKVSELEKLTTLDPELLQKYSKVYFLNENYFPSDLSLLDSTFLFKPTPPVQTHSKVRPYLESLLRAAKTENIDLIVLSSYRSFETQKDVKALHNFIYGANSANRFSADQGYSEHQLGTTVDFTTKKTAGILNGFDKTPAYPWLLENAHHFGFILSYPKDNSYYIFEPWHWRYVGVTLAAYLHTQGKNFYDLPQRNIDPYLIKIFD